MPVSHRIFGNQTRPLTFSVVDIGKESRAAALALLAYDHREPGRLSSSAFADQPSTMLTLDLEVRSRSRRLRLWRTHPLSGPTSYGSRASAQKESGYTYIFVSRNPTRHIGRVG